MSEPDRIEWNDLQHAGALNNVDDAWCDHPACPLCELFRAQIAAEKKPEARIAKALTPSERDALVIELLNGLSRSFNGMAETFGEQLLSGLAAIDNHQNSIEGRLAGIANNLETHDQDALQMLSSLENRIMEQQRYGEALARLEAQLSALGEVARGWGALTVQLERIEGILRKHDQTYRYAHMCRDGHEQIGHNDSEHELCPLCREMAKRAPRRAKQPQRKAKR